MQTTRARRLFAAAAVAVTLTTGALTSLAGPAAAAPSVTTQTDPTGKRPWWDQIDPNLCMPGSDLDKCHEEITK